MHIGLVAPPWVPVPPTLYGGTEAVIDTLARGLAERGHHVVLATTGDATCPVERHWVYPTPPEPMGSTLPELHHVRTAYDALAGCDVIHDHTLTGPLWASTLRDRPPVLATHHGEFSEPARRFFAHVAPHVSINGISHHQAAQATGVPVSAVVHHGLDLERFLVGDGKGDYLLFVGRCSPDKGVAEAIEIARKADMPIVVVAKKREGAELRYFEERVAPLLGPGVEYLGEVHPDERDRLMRDALALVNPISWDEPFGLVMVEALACGTPVVAYPAGAAPEIIDDGVTGFLCTGQDEAVAALGKVRALDRSACRAAVDKRFPAERMVADYLDLYAAMARGELGGRTA
jgi:glycosyltransferase involved in cell wall biosynthesis